MSTAARYESVAVEGGERFDAYCAAPDGGGPSVIVCYEFLGINDNMQGLAERLADVGYVTLVPDMFWRIERHFERKDESGMVDAFAVVQRFDYGAAAGDIEATHRHLLSMPECDGRVGVLGFCFGGGLAFAAGPGNRQQRMPDGREDGPVLSQKVTWGSAGLFRHHARRTSMNG